MKTLPFQKMAALLVACFFALSLTAAERKTLTTGVAGVTARLQRLAPLPATQRLQLAIGLPLRNKPALSNLVQQLYSRRSPKFHQYLTPAQFADQFGPKVEDYQKVIDFAKANRLEVIHTYGNRALVDVAGNVSDIEGAFQIHLGAYQHPTEDRPFFGPDTMPTVSSDLPISYVVGLDDYELPRPQIRMTTAPGAGGNGTAPGGTNTFLGTGSGTNGWYQGKDLRNAYVPGVSLTGSGQTVGLFELDGYNASDIAKYNSLAGLSAVPLNPIVLPGASGTAGGNNDEVCLDIEMVESMAQGLNQIEVVEGYTGVDAMNELAAPSYGEPLALQISSSWGFTGSPSLETQLLEMASQGQTFYMASGDSGAPAAGIVPYNADFNYLTEVGGTELYMTGTGTAWTNETVWDYQFISGASTGFVATDLAIPSYQSAVNPSRNGGSTSYRNGPDVAAVADYLVLVYTETFTNGNPPIKGFVQHVGGTSAAAPLWAAFTSLVNQQAVGQGKPTVGFINPALYDIAQGPLYNSCFHDVVAGNNTSTNSDNLYYAGVGYDNCTGLGSPNGQAMIDALVGYTGPVFVDFNYTGTQNGSFYQPYNTIGAGISAVSPGGTIFIKTAGATAETPVITKPLTITAIDGTGVIGQ